jgi:uncharacterized protein YegL
MNTNLTEIVLVVDRSGSMSSCRDEAENGINHFVEEQKKLEGEANLTLVQFDNEYEFLHEGTAINDVDKYTLIPRGMTALLDATGRAIAETGARLAEMDEADRPGLVAFVIVTDGQENASKEYDIDRIKEMVEEQETKYNWQFTFLGAGVDAFKGGSIMGFSGAMANYDPSKTAMAYTASCSNLSRMRHAVAYGDEVVNKFTDAELKAMKA